MIKHLEEMQIDELGDELLKELVALRGRTVKCGEPTDDIDEVIAEAKMANGNPVKLGKLMNKIHIMAQEGNCDGDN